MASNPPNPYDVNQLNGVTFNEVALGKAVPSTVSGTDGAERTVGDILQPGTTYAPRNPGTITVVDGNYIAGSQAYYGGYPAYILPTFGTITFSNIVNNQGEPINYYIHGFTENGLLLSPIKYISNEFGRTANYGDLGGDGLQNRAFILSNYGFDGDGLTFPATFDRDPSVYQAPPVCFVAGTRIETPNGPSLVEDLIEGQEVLTVSGVARPVKWIGQMLVRPATRIRPHEAHPVRVRAHAFGPDLPRADVRMSPGHAVLVDGVLVPVGLLVNGATIVQEEVESVRYFHVELETHDVLLAEGLPCESYFDDGNRSSFANAEPFAALHSRLDPQSWDHACAPMVAAGPQLAALQQRLFERAEALGWTRSETPGLTIAVAGQAVAPLHSAGNRHWFALPAGEGLVLHSNASVLAHVMPGIGDGRTLGVALGELRVDGAVVPLDDAAFGRGFYGVERHEDHGWRWTNGAAEIALTLAAPTMVEVALTMVAPSWRRAVPELRVVA